MTDIIATIQKEMDIQIDKMGQISETIRALEYEFDQINEQYLLNLDQYLQLQTEELKTNPPKNLKT